jgi:hypothetical protein
MKVAIFWDIAPCSLYMNRRFGGTYHLYLQGRKSAKQNNQRAQLPSYLLSWLIFNPEDGGDTFLRNVSTYMDYTVLYSRRWQLSVTVLPPVYFNSLNNRFLATNYTYHAGTTTTNALPCLKGVSNYVYMISVVFVNRSKGKGKDAKLSCTELSTTPRRRMGEWRCSFTILDIGTR